MKKVRSTPIRSSEGGKSIDLGGKKTPTFLRAKKENRPPLHVEIDAPAMASPMEGESETSPLGASAQSLGSSIQSMPEARPRSSRRLPPLRPPKGDASSVRSSPSLISDSTSQSSRRSSSRRLKSFTNKGATPAERKSARQKQEEFDRIVQGAQALDNAANDMFAKGNYDEALSCYSRALKLKKRTLKFGVAPGSDNAQSLLASVATSINNIGYLRQRAGGTTEEIMAAYQDSLQIKKEILGEKDLSVGKTLNNIGSVYFGTRKYKEAMKAYEQAQVIMSENLGATHLDVGTVHSNIGDVHLAQRQLERARVCYSDALKIRWNQLGEHHAKVVRLLEKIAAIEMADSPQKMQRSIRIMGDDDRTADEEEESYAPDIEMKALRQAVKEDVVFVEKIKREMALEMIRDKIQMLREMKELDGRTLEEHSLPLTPDERTQALSDIKERVEAFKKRKGSGEHKRMPDVPIITSPPVAKRSIGTRLESQFESAVQVSVDS